MIFFNYYRKVHSTTVLASRGTTFWARSRRRFVLSSRVLNIFTRGLLLRPRFEVYSRNPVEFRCQSQHWTFWADPIARTLLTVEWVQLTERPPHLYQSQNVLWSWPKSQQTLAPRASKQCFFTFCSYQSFSWRASRAKKCTFFHFVFGVLANFIF